LTPLILRKTYYIVVLYFSRSPSSRQMNYNNQSEDEEMDEVTQVLIQEDVVGKRQRYMEAQSQHLDDCTAVSLPGPHKKPCHDFPQELANNPVSSHAVSQVITSSDQVCLAIIQRRSSARPPTRFQTPVNFNGYYGRDPPGWVHGLPEAFSEAIKATMPEVMAVMATGIKEVCRCIGLTTIKINLCLQTLEQTVQAITAVQTSVGNMQSGTERRFDDMATKLFANAQETQTVCVTNPHLLS
jgi:hypothetical protein